MALAKIATNVVKSVANGEVSLDSFFMLFKLVTSAQASEADSETYL